MARENETASDVSAAATKSGEKVMKEATAQAEKVSKALCAVFRRARSGSLRRWPPARVRRWRAQNSKKEPADRAVTVHAQSSPPSKSKRSSCLTRARR